MFESTRRAHLFADRIAQVLLLGSLIGMAFGSVVIGIHGAHLEVVGAHVELAGAYVGVADAHLELAGAHRSEPAVVVATPLAMADRHAR